jgi:KDO2-lipid IV(A) lauroyltransferase
MHDLYLNLTIKEDMITWLSYFLCRIPQNWLPSIAKAIGWLWWHCIPIRIHIGKGNLKRAFPTELTSTERDKILQKNLAHLSLYTLEQLRLPQWLSQPSALNIQTVDIWRLDHALQQGKGVIVVTAHLGNFELIGAFFARQGYPIHALVKHIKWQPAEQFWRKLRQNCNIHCIEPRQSGLKIVKLLQKNQIVAFPIDQHFPPHRAIPSRFFGHMAATTPAPIRLALLTGAPILPIYIIRERFQQHTIVCEPFFALEYPHHTREQHIAHNTERLNQRIETWIRCYPEQWLWLHRRWKLQTDQPRNSQ